MLAASWGLFALVVPIGRYLRALRPSQALSSAESASLHVWPRIEGVSWSMGRTDAGELCTLSIWASCAEVEFAESLHSRVDRLRAAAHHVNVL